MKSTLEQIEDIKKNGYFLDFSTVFNHAFENYKKIALYAGLILLVFSILAFFLGGGLLVSLYGVQHFNEEFLKNLQNEQTSTSVLAIYSLVIAFTAALFSPFTAGFLKMAYCADRDEEFKFSTVFSYYTSRHFTQLFIATLLISLLSGLISVLFNMAGIILIDTLMALAITIFTALTIPLIIFGDLNAIDAIKSSIIIVSKQPFTIILLLFVAGVGSAIGLIGCCIGVVFTIPITYSVNYALYSAILNIEEENSIDSIGSDSE
jgi:MFS family permease